MTHPFERLLVATDFSAPGNAAVPVAFSLAKSQGASILLAHVLEGIGIPNPLYAHYVPTPSAEALRELEQRARAELAMLVPAGCETIPHQLVVSRGPTAEELCRIAEEGRVSLIVISSHGRSGAKHPLVGGVADRVVRRAPCSVLVLR
jgi:nucleotide-binding universal stress UspA family protein